MKTNIQIIVSIALAILIFSSCSKQKKQPETKQAIMKMEVSYTGDIQSQVVVLTFLAVNSGIGVINILNESTGIASAGPFIQNEDFDSSKLISFRSVDKVSSAGLTLSLSPKLYATTPERGLSITIKIYFDGKLADNQTFSYEHVSDGISQSPKDFDYTVTVH